MDRQIVYPGSIPLDTDLLNAQRNAMVALGYLAQATFGTGTIADGLACVPTQPASLGVAVGPGSITQLGVVDVTAFGSLPATAQPLFKFAVNLDSTAFSVLAPALPGQATNYLIQASLLESDATPVVLPYYNAASPAQPFSGPGNSGAAQTTQRLQRVQLQLKAGAPGPAGTQSTPAVDAGWVGLYVVTVAYGQTAVSAANIATLPTAPFITWKLPQLSPGTRNLAVFSPANQGLWNVPPGVSVLRLRIWGGGGAGGAGFGGAGGGGAGAGYCEGFFSVAPGQSYFVTVGNGGVGSGTTGGTSSFGSLASASGGGAGGNGATNAAGAGAATGGNGVGAGLLLTGSGGAGAFAAGSVWVSGQGGAAHSSGGAVPSVAASGSSLDGHVGSGPGGGGSGGVGGGAGGQGGAGSVLVEW